MMDGILKLDPQRLTGRFRRLPRIAEGINHEAGDRGADTGVGDVKGRPRVREGDVQIKEQEIDDVTVEQAVGQISEDAGH